MAKRGVIKTFFGSILNVRQSIAYDEIRAHSKLITSTLKDIFKKEEITQEEINQRQEPFDEAMQRLGLTESDIKKKKRTRLLVALFYLVFGLSMSLYAVYLFSLNLILASIATSVMAILLITYALKEHFWYTQLKHRKLNCTLTDWFYFTIGARGKKDEKK